MAQTLVVLPTLTLPITLAQSATLAANISAIQNLDNRMTLALSVQSALHELFSAGGFDYRNNHAQLRTDSAALMGAFNENSYLTGQVAKLRAVMDWSDASKLDGTYTGNVNTLVAEMKGLRETPEQTLELMYYFLQYLLPQ